MNRISVLVAASGATWETDALQELSSAGPGIVVLKRCVDLPDLLATAMTGQAQVAVLAEGLPGVDADSLAHLRRCGVGVVMVTESAQLDPGAEGRLRQLGADHLVSENALRELRVAVTEAGSEPQDAAPDAEVEVGGLPEPPTSRSIAVWGPAGAPGRTTVAVGVASELASRGGHTFLIDADPYGGAVAQHLGILDEVSGLLAAARMANAGQLDRARLAVCARSVGSELRVLTGLPRADRWTEAREPSFSRILDVARELAETTVVDTGFCLEEDADASFGGAAPQRNQMTLSALEHADEVLAVGSADPVGLARLARGLVDLVERVPGSRIRVVVNRTRSSLGWQREEVTAMLEDFVTPEGVHFLGEDRATCDRALVGGKSLAELGDTSLRRGVSAVVDAMVGQVAHPQRRGGLRLRRAGTAR